MSQQPPARIYKYENFTVQSLRNLKSQSLYFGSPKNFNDPYDCALNAEVSIPTDEEIKAVRAHYLRQDDLPLQGRRQLEAMNSIQLKEVVIRGARHLADQQAEKFLSERGVTCFSEINDDLLMWSHYGGKYKGYCLEFATDYEPFQKLRKVKYVTEMPRIDAAAFILREDYDQYLDLYCTKSVAWSYEKEWRAIHNVAGTSFTYPSEALLGVYFGPDIDQDCLEIVCLILAGQNEHVSFSKGVRSQQHFKVEFQSFTYTPYLDAKRQGLISDPG